MMNAQEFIDYFEGRGFSLRIVNGGLRVEPFAKLSRDDRTEIAKAAADAEGRTTLERLLRDRRAADAATSGSPAAPEEAAKLSPADALVIGEIQRKLPDSPLIKIGRPDPGRRPDLVVEVINRSDEDPIDFQADDPLPADGRKPAINHKDYAPRRH